MTETDANAPFLLACRRQPVPHTPIWIMRQAGRYLPEYRALREKYSFVEMMRTPDLAAEVTLQPLRRFAMDAAILFSDIITPLEGLGIDYDFNPGPKIANPVRDVSQIDRLKTFSAEEDVLFVHETLGMLRRELKPETALIGFAGAPFTLFCYLVAGQSETEFPTARKFLLSEPEGAKALLLKLGDAMGRYLKGQIDAGADAVMLFESWAGLLNPRLFAAFAKPAVERALLHLRPSSVPVIYFANQGAALFEQVRDLDIDVAGIDWRCDLGEASRVLGPEFAVQGNLDPAALFAERSFRERMVDDILAAGRQTPGHIFNLGHGIWPSADPDAVAHLVDYVHEHSVR